MQKRLKSKSATLIFGLVCMALAYGAASKAIDTGRWLYYFLTFALLFVGLKYVIQFFKTYGHR